MEKYKLARPIIVGATIVFVALVGGCTVSTIHADTERTAQMKNCMSQGNTYMSGAPTLCVAPGQSVLDMSSNFEIKGGTE